MADERPFEGLTVVVVEDESLVLFDLEDMLADLGCKVIGSAMRHAQAHALATTGERPEVAILDVNLGGTLVFPVAEALAARQVPIIFTTGYGRDGLPEEWQDRIVLTKPYSPDDVANGLAQAIGRA